VIDWWQALALSLAASLATGAVSLITAYRVHAWATSARREEEQRQMLRTLRRERLKPVFDAIDLLRRTLSAVYAMRLKMEHGAIAGLPSVSAPDSEQLVRTIVEATVLTTGEIHVALETALKASLKYVQNPGDAETIRELSTGINALADAVERHLVEIGT